MGAHLYRDCQTDDARLVLENVLNAENAGAAIANHLPVVNLVRDRRAGPGAAVLDAETNAGFEVRAHAIVTAAGPFTDGALLAGQVPPRLRPTLGVHLVFDAARVPHHDGRVLVLRTPGDNRLFFSMPAGPRTIIGTTRPLVASRRSPSPSPGGG